MPFGLCNARPTFQRLMQNCLGELNLTYCLIYLDDVIVFSQTEEEHLERMHVVFDFLHEHGLKLKPSKCDVFKTEINYLAHYVSKKGVLPSKKNLEAIAECPSPDTCTKVKSFVGLVGHYRHFIKGFANIAANSLAITSPWSTRRVKIILWLTSRVVWMTASLKAKSKIISPRFHIQESKPCLIMLSHP